MTHPGEELVTVQVKRTFLGIKGQARDREHSRAGGPHHSQAVLTGERRDSRGWVESRAFRWGWHQLLPGVQ